MVRLHSKDMVVREAGLRRFTCIVRDRQPRLFEHVARIPREDPAHRIPNCRDPSGWTVPMGRPEASCLGQVVLSEGYRHWGPGICLGDGQPEAEGIPSPGGSGDTLHLRMPHTCPGLFSYFGWKSCIRGQMYQLILW